MTVDQAEARDLLAKAEDFCLEEQPQASRTEPRPDDSSDPMGDGLTPVLEFWNPKRTA